MAKNVSLNQDESFSSLMSKFRSQSLNDLRFDHSMNTCQSNEDIHISNTARTEIDLSNIGNDVQCNNPNCDNDTQQSRSAPVSPTHIYDKEFAAFIQCEQQQKQVIADNFVYNMDLSDTMETVHQPQSKMAVFFDDDFTSDDLVYPVTPVSLIHSNLINSCLTITEENEEELEQLRLEEQQKKCNHLVKLNDRSNVSGTLHDDDDRADLLENDDQISSMMTNRSLIHFDENSNERLSTIYEAPSPPPPPIEEEEEDEDMYDKLIVYDIVEDPSITKPSIISSKKDVIVSLSSPSPSSSFRSSTIDRCRLRPSYTEATFPPCPSFPNPFSASNLCGTTTMITSKVFYPPSSPIDDKSSSSPVINVRTLPSNQSSPSRSSAMSLSVPLLLLPSNVDENEEKKCSTEHIKKMKVIQSSSSSLSDFINQTQMSPLKNHSSHYEEVPSVHQSLTDCSLIQQMSCCVALAEDEESSLKPKSSDDTSRRPSFTRRILTNGLLLSHCTNPSHPRRMAPPLTFNSQQNAHHRTSMKPKSEEKLSSPTSSSSSTSSTSSSYSPRADKLMSRSEYILQEQDKFSQQRKSTSLKSIRISSNETPSKILYPIDFENHPEDPHWYPKRSSSHDNKVPTSDSGIVIDTAGTRPTSKSSIDDNDADVLPIDIINSSYLKQYEHDYRQTLTDLTLIKKDILSIESRLNEAMRELEIERALVEGEHDLVFKQILDASESDQEKLTILYDDLQQLINRIMSEKTGLRRQIEYTQEILFKLEDEFHELEREYRPTDDKIVKKREILLQTRKKQEDLEFQLMELETRCEAELEQAEEHFQNERLLVTQNAKLRQNTLHDLDHQQQLIFHQVTMEKEKLEREKQKLKLLFKQKKFEANELEEKIHQINSNQQKCLQNPNNGHYPSSTNRNHWLNGQDTQMYRSTPSNLYSSFNCSDGITSNKTMTKDDHQEKLNEIKEMIAVAKLEKMSLLEQQLRERYNELVHCQDEQTKRVELEEKLANEVQRRDHLVENQVKLREKSRLQERPLTRYLPVRSLDFDLRAHIEGAGHLVDSPHIHLTSTTCRGFLHKMGGMKFKTWNRRWFVFDRKRRSLFYYQDKTESKLRGCIYFQSIVEVYVDHLQSISLRTPEPREATLILKTFERSFYLVAPTVESMRIWVDVLITGAEGNTFAGES